MHVLTVPLKGHQQHSWDAIIQLESRPLCIQSCRPLVRWLPTKSGMQIASLSCWHRQLSMESKQQLLTHNTLLSFLCVSVNLCMPNMEIKDRYLWWLILKLIAWFWIDRNGRAWWSKGRRQNSYIRTKTQYLFSQIIEVWKYGNSTSFWKWEFNCLVKS